METPSPARRTSLSANTIVSTRELHDHTMWTAERVFQALDADGSKHLDVTELSLGLSAVLGHRITQAEAERVFRKADLDSDGKMSFKEFEKFSKSGKLGKSFLGYFKKSKKPKAGIVHADVLAIRQEVLAKEMSKGGEKVTVTDLRLLKPLPTHYVTSLTCALHFVETDFSCPGLYRFSKTKKKDKNLKVMHLLERAQRIAAREFRDAVGQNGAVVATAVVDMINDYAPLVPYKLYDELTSCKSAKEVKLLFQKSVEEGKFNQVHLDFVGSLCIHLFDLLKFSDRNMMGIDQLKQVLGHLVCRRNEDGMGGDKLEVEKKVKDQTIVGDLFALLVKNSEDIFGEREEFLWGERARKDPEKKSMWKNSTSQSEIVNYSALVLDKGKIMIGGKDRQAEVMISKTEEMAIILKAGEASDPASTGGRWYLVESKFVYDWLAYVAMKEKMVEGVSERPRKIDNTKLLGVQENTKLWYMLEDKKCASHKHPGDYRLVNQQTWKKFCNLYPGSGPAIYVEDGDKEDLYHFYIDQLFSPYAKEREITEYNEFDEYTMNSPVFKRNRGPNGSAIDFYRDSGLENMFRASGEFFGGFMNLFEGSDELGEGGYAQMETTVSHNEKEERELQELLDEHDEIMEEGGQEDPKTPPRTKKVSYSNEVKGGGRTPG